MRYAILFLLLCGCISLPRLPALPSGSVAAPIAAKVAQEAQEAPPPATSSTEAQQQLQQLLKTWDGIRLYSAKIGEQIKSKKSEIKTLKREEVAASISAWAWWGLAASVILSAVAGFFVLRLGGKSAWTLLGCGIISVALSLSAIYLAPYWYFTACIVGAGAALVLGILVYRQLMNSKLIAATREKAAQIHQRYFRIWRK
jgi:hypothetical protein